MKKHFIYGNSVPLHSLPLEEVTKEWAKKHLPAVLRTDPGKESSTLKTLKNKEPKVKFWFNWKIYNRKHLISFFNYRVSQKEVLRFESYLD